MIRIITGNDLSDDLFLKTYELCKTTFKEKYTLTEKESLDYFHESDRSTIVLYDDENKEMIGYITPYLINHEFASHYITSNQSFKNELNKKVFVKPYENVDGDICIFSTVVKKEYRDKMIFSGKPAIKILTEALVDYICDVKRKGVSINYVFAERYTEDGEKYLKSLKLKKCFTTINDDKYAGIFSPYMFEKSDNVNKLYDLYSEEYMRKTFDKSILNNHEYLSFNNNHLFYKDIYIFKLVKKYGAPLEVAYLPMITERITKLKNIFEQKIKKYNYYGSYSYAYATKANYNSEVVTTALKNVDFLETSSAYDISIIVDLVNLNYIKPSFTILCNGFKNKEYIDNIKKLLEKGINVVPIIENEDELKLLSELDKYNVNVGLRYNCDFESRIIKEDFENEDEHINRFGFNEETIFRVADEIRNKKNLVLKVFHFHFGGMISNIDSYIKGLESIFDLYSRMQTKYKTLEYFDFGGGFPTKYSLTYNFNYDELVDKKVKTFKKLSLKNSICEPK
jgi:diaminopimelate decarboxylase